jgi:CBS domain containing-hemolysin-like protein
MEIVPIVLLLLILLALIFFFAGIETGIISLNRLKLEHDARTNKKKEQLLKFIEHPDKFLGTSLIGNNIFNVILASIATYLVQEIALRHPDYVFDARWTSLGVGFIVLIFAEILPKAIFRDYADSLVVSSFPLLKFFYNLFRPLVAAVSWINRHLHRLLKIDKHYSMVYLTRDDLAFILTQSGNDVAGEPHREMIEDALEFNDQKARNVMVQRTDVIAISEDATIPEVLELARAEGFTRYPVFHLSLDNIVGVLIIYDIIRKAGSETMTAGQLVHEPFFVPENMDLDILLKEMQKNHKSMAIVVDSFGGTAGIVTMEDIMEEIVGEIEDEFDTEEGDDNDVEQVGPNTWIVAADVEIDTLIDEYDMDLPEGDYETVAGLILDKLERIPNQGQILHFGHYRLQVLQATDKRIIKVKIHLTEKHEKNEKQDKNL